MTVKEKAESLAKIFSRWQLDQIVEICSIDVENMKNIPEVDGQDQMQEIIDVAQMAAEIVWSHEVKGTYASFVDPKK